MRVCYIVVASLVQVLVATTSKAQTISHTNIPASLGTGLQVTIFTARLSTSAHGGKTVRIESGDPARLLIASSATALGGALVDVFVPNGQTDAVVTLQATDGIPVGVTVTSSTAGFTSDADNINIVQSAIRMAGFNTAPNELAGLDVIVASIGVPNAGQTNLQTLQRVRAGSSVVVTLTSSDSGVAELTTSGGSGAMANVTIAGNSDSSPASIAAGGVALDPVSDGQTVIAATAPGVISTTAATQTVIVAAASLDITGEPASLAAGHQDTNVDVALSGANHGGVTLRIQSTGATGVLLAPNATTVGTPTLDLALADGSSTVNFVLQAPETLTGAAMITATVLNDTIGVTPASASVNVVTPALRITGLGASTSSIDAQDVFAVDCGVPNAGQTTLISAQSVRAGSSLVVTVSNSAAGVGQLVTAALTGQVVQSTIAANTSNTPASVASGGVALDPIAAGTTMVTASAPGYITTTAGIVNVTVTNASMTFVNSVSTVGAGLQSGPSIVRLSGGTHGGVTVRIESADPTRLLIAPTSGTVVGAAFLDVPVANGQIDSSYLVQAVNDTIGTVQVTATAIGFDPITRNVDVVQPALQILNLNNTHTAIDPDDAFVVRVGTPNAGGTAVATAQRARAGFPLTATVTNSDAGVGQLTTLGGSAQMRTVTIAADTFDSPGSVASGGIAFDSLAAGQTVVSASIPGFIITTAGVVTVEVSASPTLNIVSAEFTVGSGLQRQLTVNLSLAAPSAFTLRLESDNPGVAILSDNATTPGGAFVDIPVSMGIASRNFVLQGVAGTTGAATITASAPGWVSDTLAATIAQPAIRIDTSIQRILSTDDIDDPFTVTVGVPNVNVTAISSAQQVSAAAGPLSVNLVSSNPAAALLVTNEGAAAARTIAINVASETSTNAAISVRPVSAGDSIVSASAAGFLPLSGGDQTVSVYCPGDANRDGSVSFADITSVLTFFNINYQPGTGEGDANGDGPVNFSDVTEVLTFFGGLCP